MLVYVEQLTNLYFTVVPFCSASKTWTEQGKESHAGVLGKSQMLKSKSVVTRSKSGRKKLVTFTNKIHDDRIHHDCVVTNLSL